MMAVARLLAAVLLLLANAVSIGAAETAPSSCTLPSDALPPAVALPAAKAAVAARHRLVVLTMGGAPMAGGPVADPSLTYPARLQAHLERLLPNVEVTIANRAVPDRSARSMARRLAEEAATMRPDLVIWASGGREAVRNADVAAYAGVLETGIAAIRAAGADVILVDTQFAPGWAAIPNIDAYRTVIRTVGELQSVPVFPRFDLMQAWHEAGVLNLDAADRHAQVAVARTLFDCLGDALARMVLEGIR